MSTNNNSKQTKRSRSRSRSRSKERKDKTRTYNDNYRYQKNTNKNYRRDSDDGVKIYLANLSSNLSDRKIMDEFEDYGQVLDINIRRRSGKSYCYGYVKMKNRTIAEQALEGIQNKKLGWKASLYERDNDDRRSRYPNHSRSRSNSSNSKSYSKRRESNNSNNNLNESSYKNANKETEDSNNTRENRNLDEIKTARVREIWIGNLPNNISESTLYNNFFIYGEIAKIDLHSDRNYAFIKYRLCQSASRAYEKAKNMTLNGSVIKISFSDNGKRRDILGDESGFELSEKTCKLLHVSLNKNSQIPADNVLKDVFKKYGHVKALHVKNNSGFRSSIYIEYSKPEEAENAVNQLMTLDVTGEKRKLIGDPSCEVNFYFKKKNINYNNYSYEMGGANQTNFSGFASNFFNNPNFRAMMANAAASGNNANMAQLMAMGSQIAANQGMNTNQVNFNQNKLLQMMMNQISQTNLNKNKQLDEKDANSNPTNNPNNANFNNFSANNQTQTPQLNQVLNMSMGLNNMNKNLNNPPNNMNQAFMNMNQTQNQSQQSFNNANPQNMRWNMPNQGINNPNANQMQAILMKQLYLQQQNQQNNQANNPNAPNNLCNQMQNSTASNNPNLNINNSGLNLPNNYQQMLMNNQQQQVNPMNNQAQKLNQQSNQMNMPNMMNYNLLNNNANLQTGQKDNFASKFANNNNFNNPNVNNFNNKLPNAPNQSSFQPNSNNPLNPEFLNNLAFMGASGQNKPQNTKFPVGFQPNMLNPNQIMNPPIIQNNPNFPLSNNQNNPSETPGSGAGNMDMIKLIQDAISNLKSKGNAENQAEKIQGGTNNGESDISYGGASLKNEFESQYSLEDENLKQLWSGFLTKNKKDKVCVDAYQIRHECSHFFTSEFNLNVSHRTQFEEIMKRPIIGVIAFSPQNETQCENFLEYINYFQEKDRAGVVNFKSQATMYIVPPGEFSRKFYQNPKKHLLGIFVDSSVDVEKYVDMNQLKLPPPVISSAEKKLLLKQQKNKQMGLSTTNPNLNVSTGCNQQPMGNSGNALGVNSAGVGSGNIQGFSRGNPLEALAFSNLNTALMNKPNTDYDELIKNMTNEEKELLMRLVLNSNKQNE